MFVGGGGGVFNVSLDREFLEGRNHGSIHCYVHSAWHRICHVAHSRNLTWYEILSGVFPVF